MQPMLPLKPQALEAADPKPQTGSSVSVTFQFALFSKAPYEVVLPKQKWCFIASREESIGSDTRNWHLFIR